VTLGEGLLEQRLRRARDGGRKLLIPYVTGGMTPEWIEVVHAAAAAGADAIEIGIPFSDPMIDGPTIQRASMIALEAGTTPAKIVGALRREDPGVPLVVMTYYNLVFRAGHRRFARSLADAGITGAIVPDLPFDEAGEWCDEADHAGVDTVLLVAPSTPDERAARICERSRGFVYGIGRMGVTGERPQPSATASDVARRLHRLTDLPVCIGIGVSNPAQAREICSDADGVVVGAALVRRLLEGGGPEGAARFVSELRAAIDFYT
jgi:tryptophan synthase alpha chain